MSSRHPKFTGEQFQRFYGDPSLFTNVSFDDMYIMVDGKDRAMDDVWDKYGDNLENLPADAVVVLETGDIRWEGEGKAPPRADDYNLVEAAHNWLKVQPELGIQATIRLEAGAVPADEDYVLLPRRLVDGTDLAGSAIGLTGLPKPAQPQGPTDLPKPAQPRSRSF